MKENKAMYSDTEGTGQGCNNILGWLEIVTLLPLLHYQVLQSPLQHFLSSIFGTTDMLKAYLLISYSYFYVPKDRDPPFCLSCS